ncbi:MAG: class I SAM-dependent methyltransferase [Ignavibacteriaceae bacterium]
MDLITESKIYERLPLIYNYIMRSVNYSLWAKYIYSLVKDDIAGSSSVLELGAGNCNFTNKLCSYFPNILATDISRNMLISGDGALLPRVCCDMKMLPFKSQFDLIYSCFDSVNYISSRKNLLSMFKQISKLLPDSGIFTFDASLEKNSLAYAKKPERSGTYKGIKFSQKSEYNLNTKIHKNTFILKLKSGEYFSEVHNQKIFSFETYFNLLELAGLRVRNCYEAFSFKQGSASSERVQFIIKKVK